MNALLLAATLTACGGSGLPTAKITVDGNPLTVELATDSASRAQGLMYRDSLGDDRGMLFVYPEERERGFWMKNTRIPLSIAYADREGTIVHIADMTPLSTRRVLSVHPAAYALEVNKGWFSAHDVEVGDRIEGLPDDLKVE